MAGMAAATPRDILARNLNRMIDRATPPGAKRSVRAWALGKGLDVRLIDRLTKGQHAVTLDTLDEIAQTLGLRPWQLLLEDLDPATPPEAPVSEEDRLLLRKLRRLLGD